MIEPSARLFVGRPPRDAGYAHFMSDVEKLLRNSRREDHSDSARVANFSGGRLWLKASRVGVPRTAPCEDDAPTAVTPPGPRVASPPLDIPQIDRALLRYTERSAGKASKRGPDRIDVSGVLGGQPPEADQPPLLLLPLERAGRVARLWFPSILRDGRGAAAR